jgi:sec-independent protein translocase protein TatB
MLLPDFSASHMLIVAVIALIVVGPKDLPLVLRKIGQFVSKARSMAADFRSSFDDMARQSELEDLRKEVEAMRASAGQAIEDHTQVFNEHSQAISQGIEGDSFYHDPFDPYAAGIGQPVDATPAAAAEPVAKVPRKRAPKKAAAEPLPEPMIVDAPKRTRRKASSDIVT